MNKRVMICANTAWNLFNFREGLIRALLQRGFEVVAVAPTDNSVGELVAMGCRFVALPMDNKGTSPHKDALLYWRFLRLLKHERPTAFLGYTIKPNVYGSLAAQSLGISTINNIAGLGSLFNKDTWLTRLAKTFYRIALKNSKIVFFQNQDDKALFIENRLVRAETIRLLPGSGVDLDRFSVSVPRNASDNPIQFLLIARMLWDKGVGEFVEAARLVRKQYPDVSFQLLGFLDVLNPSAIDRRTMDSWVSEGAVKYLGATGDVRPFIDTADCVVLPSFYREGVPHSLLEGAAMGKPLITTDWVGCREVVDDGVNGYLVNPRDAADLAAKMLDFIALSKEERQAMGRASRAKAEREFDEKIVIDRYLQEINALVR